MNKLTVSVKQFKVKQNNVQNILSYILPVQIETGASPFNPFLEVSLRKGTYLLNSLNSNYSFGSLHVIFEQAFERIGLETLNISNCLLLGLGGGSVVHLIRNKYKLDFPITAVEIDPVVIGLGEKYFDHKNYAGLNIIKADAFNYVKTTNIKYDLIIIDLYIDDQVPDQFHSTEFVTALKPLIKDDSFILFNKMLKNVKQEQEYNRLVLEMAGIFNAIRLLSVTVNDVENKIICVNDEKVKTKLLK